MCRRRVSCPVVTQQLWDAIKIIKSHRQVPNFDRISRYMARVHNTKEDDVKHHLNHCVRDRLIVLSKRVGCKGSKVGIEQEGYYLPKSEPTKDKHDWYCFGCHNGGDVICCTGCHRVYHLACIAKEELPEEDVKNTFVCQVCKLLRTPPTPELAKIKKKHLNRLLGFTCIRLKERLPMSVTECQVQNRTTFLSDRQSQPPIKCVQGPTETFRASHLIYQNMDLRTMEGKANSNKYKSLEEFEADAQTIVHNVVIYHGVHSALADLARQMLRDCIYDLQEIRQCRDCYRVSNEKKDKYWFCQPCRPPHQLVYAKQKGFHFWPAKVIKVDGDQYDVRFFGGFHQRAKIEKANIRPITVSITSLQVKRTSSWNKAAEELRRHQDLLEKLREETNNFTTNLDDSSSDDDDDSEEESEPEVPVTKPAAAPESSDDDLDEDESDDEEYLQGAKEESLKKDESKVDSDESKAPVEDPKAKEEKVEEVKKEQPKKPKKGEAKGKRNQQKTKKPEDEVKEELTNDENEVTLDSGQLSEEIPKELEETKRRPGRKRKSTVVDIDTEEEGECSSSSSRPKITSKKERVSPEDLVTSSSQEPRNRCVAVQTTFKAAKSPKKDVVKEIENAHKEEIEQLKNELEIEKQKAVKAVEERLKIEKVEEISALTEKHKQLVSEIKKKQWCYNCESEAIYHCCWNTAYCSIECQQLHWQKEHKRVCRRKR